MPELSHLVVIETQRVKRYLFASPILRETRGGSLLLDQLNRVETAALVERFGGETIYLGGGSGRILFADHATAAAFAAGVASLYESRTGGAQVSLQVVSRRPGENFAVWVARGVRLSQRAKLAQHDATTIIAGRWIRPCTSCGVEPAERWRDNGVCCRLCGLKRESVREFYRDVKRNRDARIPLNRAVLHTAWRDFVLTTLVDEVATRYGEQTFTLVPQDIDQVAAASRPSNYIGLIYADGNRMGETVQRIGTVSQDDEQVRQSYAAFSAIVDRATREAAVAAVLDALAPQPEQTLRGEAARYVPAEFVLAGGDDLILVVPAHVAVQVAADFIQLFQARTRDLQREWQTDRRLLEMFAPSGLTTSAGVVIAHASYPASQLIDLASDLMKLAKRRAAGLAKGGEPQGTLDFMVVHSSGSEGVRNRREEYTRSTGTRTVRLTERPYTAADALGLLSQIRALKQADAPRNKLKALYGVLFQGVLQAQFDAWRIVERLHATGALAANADLWRLITELPIFPFRERDGEWTTPLSELIELYDFVRQGPTSAAGGVDDAYPH